MRPHVGLNPISPVQAAGMRTLPPVSVPSATSASPAATAAALPPDEPPTVRPGAAGFLTTGVVTPKPPASVWVTPTMRAPASRNWRTAGASVSAVRSENSGWPAVKGRPATAMLSFTATRMPARGPAPAGASGVKATNAPNRSTDRLSSSPRIASAGLAVAQPVHQRFLLAAVDLDHGAVDHVHERRGQHRDQVGALLDLGDAAERDRGGRELVGVFIGELHVARHGGDEAGPALGAHRPGIDRAEADVVLAVLAGERLRQVLAGGISGARHDLPIGRLDAVVADQVHDAPAALLDHDRQHVAQAAHVAHELELQSFRPVVLGESFKHAAGRGACVVDHDVDAAERLVALRDEILGVGVLGEVGGDRDDLAPGLLGDLGCSCLEWLLAARADRDIDAFARERARDALADAFAAAGHQRGLALELKVHLGLPFGLRGHFRLYTNETQVACRARPLHPHDRFGGVADRLDVLAHVEECDDTTRTSFEPLVAPREGADEGALVEHQLDIAAQVLGVQQPFLERPVVEREHVGGDLAARFLVRVLERAEEFRRRLAVPLGELRREIGAHVADRRVHGVVAGAGVHGPPADLLLAHPVQRVEVRPGVVAEVLHQILFRLSLVVAMPAGVQNQNVTLADIGARALDDLGRDHGPIG